eukprot:TRINITY_DN6062_c0_g1_i2.p1 TRINITY_DN6062_c0_g1~~TRINITY_DN6062_c0_g1_i2.p1  ORF type:complete len:285 (-),score=16.58 TRINITY_DN6062_c0_g1_i2:55-864(-)
MTDWWVDFVSRWPGSERSLFLVGTLLATNGTFWLWNGILYIIYTRNLFADCKIDKNAWPDRKLVIACLKKLAFGDFVVRPIVLWLAYPTFQHFGLSMSAPLPTLWTFTLHWLAAVVSNDFLFYWTHRLLHHPLLYSRFHKQHHMFNASIGIAAEYAHPIEDVLSNQLPTISAPLLLGSHPAVLWSWLAYRLWQTVDVHSGYNFPWGIYRIAPWFFQGSDRHDYHHSHNLGSYGATFRFWDKLMGTNRIVLRPPTHLAVCARFVERFSVW